MLLSELYVKSVYLNLFGWRGARSSRNILRGAQATKVWEPVPLVLFSHSQSTYQLSV
jgi:hypothetical protein